MKPTISIKQFNNFTFDVNLKINHNQYREVHSIFVNPRKSTRSFEWYGMYLSFIKCEKMKYIF